MFRGAAFAVSVCILMRCFALLASCGYFCCVAGVAVTPMDEEWEGS